MAKTAKKELNLVDILTILTYFENLKKDKVTNKLGKFTTQTYWVITKNINKLTPYKKMFEETKKELEDDLRAEYFTEEKCEHVQQPQTNEAGENVLDEQGNPVLVEMLQVKDEFKQDFERAYNELNIKLQTLAVEINEVALSLFDLDAEIERLGDDMDMNDIDILSVFAIEGDE